jgi:hypothetical protein
MSVCRVFDCWEVDGGNNTNASYARILKALVYLGGQMTASYISDKTYNRSYVVYSIKLPAGSKQEFEEMSKTKLKRNPDIQIGMDTVKSVKQINYNTSPATHIEDEKDCFKHWKDAE